MINLNLKGKNALVCGSTGGIGKASALALAELGASVTLLARNELKLKQTLVELSAHDRQIHDHLVADFSVADPINKSLRDALVNKPYHILINNTGGPAPGAALDASFNDFRAAFEMHLGVAQLLTQILTPGMKQEKYGRIINIISTSVKIPIPGLGVSNTIRGAMASWAKTISSELGPFGITVNNVLPSTTMTDRLRAIINSRAEKSGKTAAQIEDDMINEIPLRRLSEPAEVASLVAFLASPAAGYISGTSIPVDGGKTGSI
jgi:3-oxoacyl-[acyl-carrier protein] reductase